jgi:PRTRC genetic system protein E
MKTDLFHSTSSIGTPGNWKLAIQTEDNISFTLSVLFTAAHGGGGAAKLIPPMILQGTAEELGAGFFEAISTPVQQTASLFAKLEQYQKQLEAAKLASKQEQDKKQKVKAEAYSPWLRRITPNANLAYLGYVHKIDDRNALGASFKYLNLGTSELFDSYKNETGYFRPYEFSLDVAMARKFSENFSIGLSLRYIHSSLTSGLIAQGQQAKPGNAVATDVSFYYRSQTQQFNKDAIFAVGVNISNIGTKVAYSDLGQKYFLPTNLKIGVTNTWFVYEYNQFVIGLDLNKLLVPTPPIRDQNHNVIKGEDDNKSVPVGIFGSFSAAPGGLQEELQEISVSPALEYWYDKSLLYGPAIIMKAPKREIVNIQPLELDSIKKI